MCISLRILLLWLLATAAAFACRTTQLPPPQPRAMFLRSDAGTTYNGLPIPVGSIVDAYDADGILCGRDTVGIAGLYGFMNVYGDDPSTSGTDEGATTGDTLTYFINCRTATPSKTRLWENMETDSVDLSASGTLAIDLTSLPNDTLVAPGDTIVFTVGVQNLGNGLDFYQVSGSSDLGWTFISPAKFSYADAAEQVFVTFAVAVPVFPGLDTVSQVNFTVYSGINNAVSESGTVQLFASITDVGGGGGKLPAGFVIHQNYPNPFNPSTTISFTLPRRAEISLSVFNLLGQEIVTLPLGSLAASNHRHEFDGSGLPSGAYFYRISTGNAGETRKMLLVK